jgi:exopolyphosphatase/guanosine-5'-triphosphate,3'-diphosphate pyrophosphatase
MFEPPPVGLSAAPRSGLPAIPRGSCARLRRVSEFAQRFGIDSAHGQCVAGLARQLFLAAYAAHRLDGCAAELLEYGALLHDVGLSISHARHHRHSHYLILNSHLKGFSADEIMVIAVLARFHRGTPACNSCPELASFGARKRKMIMMLAAMLRVADGLDRGHRAAARRIDLARGDTLWRARVHFSEPHAEAELWAASGKADAWQRSFGVPLLLARAADDSADARLGYDRRLTESANWLITE